MVLERVETHVDTGGEHPDQHLEIEEERRPRGGLMLRYRGNDRNVDLGVSSIPQRVETTRPGGNNAGQSQEHEHSHRPNKGDSEE